MTPRTYSEQTTMRIAYGLMAIDALLWLGILLLAANRIEVNSAVMVTAGTIAGGLMAFMNHDKKQSGDVSVDTTGTTNVTQAAQDAPQDGGTP